MGKAPSVLDRQARWRKLEERGLALVKQSLPTALKSALDERAVRLFELASRAFLTRRIPESLASVPSVFCQPAIRDIHHDHVLFTGDEVTGIIDFGAMRMDTPLTDVARLVGSLAGDDHEARQFALDAYAELRALSEADRKLVDLLDETGLVLGAMNWLTWLYV
jgi:Ser/Thr protein kinase RdoA (MazF antagonist)